GVVERVFRANGTRFLQIDPYAAGSIVTVTYAGASVTDYAESGGYLVFPADAAPDAEESVTVKARFGFASVPADIVQACIEQALFIFRRKDLAFADMSGVSSAALTAEYCPTFAATVRRYREIYSRNNYFA